MRAFLMFAIVVSALCSPVDAGSHSWRVNELFSTADGTIQFIELKECCGFGSEILLEGKWVMSEATGNQYFFPEDLAPGTTADRHLLLATAGFAALPGAPTPDHIIQEDFFSLVADEITYWFYGAATMTFGSGELPLDGVSSLDRDGTVGPNSPTNFAGETGSVDASPPVSDFVRGDCNGDGMVDISDPICNLGFLFTMETTNCRAAQDTNDDGMLDIADPVYNLTYQFASGPVPPGPFPGCGGDPTPSSLSCVAYPLCP